MSGTPRTDAIMANFMISICADTREQSMAHREEARRETESMERELNKALNEVKQYASEREHNAMQALAYKYERDALTAAVEAAIDCGMVPRSDAPTAGSAYYERQNEVAEMLRDALAKAKGGKP